MARPRKHQVVRFLKSYRFMPTEKDPIIDRIYDLMENEGSSIAEMHGKSGVSKATYYNWKSGKTRRPMWATASASLHALGYTVTLVPLSNSQRRAVENGEFEAEAPRVTYKERTARRSRNGNTTETAFPAATE